MKFKLTMIPVWKNIYLPASFITLVRLEINPILLRNTSACLDVDYFIVKYLPRTLAN